MKCISPIRLRRKVNDGIRGPFYDVPCGKCTACLSNKRRDWFFRLQNEIQDATSARFVTLTYDDSHLPRDGLCNKRDVQLFLKRLRKCLEPIYKNLDRPKENYREPRLRYFLVSEYGETFGRAHYHAILFNIPLDCDIQSILENSWCLGFVDVGTALSSGLNYVCKYCLANLSLSDPKSRTFMLCSRRPAIGYCFLENPDVIRYLKDECKGSFRLVGGYGERPIPRYYLDKIFNGNEKFKIQLEKRLYYERQSRKEFEDDEYYMSHGCSLISYQRVCATDANIKSKLKNRKNEI